MQTFIESFSTVVAWVFWLWFIPGFFAYGACFAYFQTEFKEIAEFYRKSDRKDALLALLLGPIGLLAVAPVSGWFKHGFKWR